MTMPDLSQETSNLVKHAITELHLAGFYDQTSGDSLDPYFEKVADDVVQLVRLFASHANSGMSAEITTSLLEALLQFKPLTPLTNDPAEWNQFGDMGWQSTRDSSAFSLDGGKTYYLLDEKRRWVAKLVWKLPAKLRNRLSNSKLVFPYHKAVDKPLA
jgi:hypothetical protein